MAWLEPFDVHSLVVLTDNLATKAMIGKGLQKHSQIAGKDDLTVI